jgi:hypothetical protein
MDAVMQQERGLIVAEYAAGTAVTRTDRQ